MGSATKLYLFPFFVFFLACAFAKLPDWTVTSPAPNAQKVSWHTSNTFGKLSEDEKLQEVQKLRVEIRNRKAQLGALEAKGTNSILHFIRRYLFPSRRRPAVPHNMCFLGMCLKICLNRISARLLRSSVLAPTVAGVVLSGASQ